MLELDVTNQEHLDGLADAVREHVDGLDGVVHSIAYGNPETLLGGKFMTGPWEDVAQAVQVSAYSLKSLTTACLPLMGEGGSIVGMTFDASVAWPGYDWMGFAKGALGVAATATWRATSARRASAATWSVPAPLKTLAAKAIPGFELFEEEWTKRAPLGWDLERPRADRARRRRAAQRLLPEDHRRDRARRRWLPRDGRLRSCDPRGGGISTVLADGTVEIPPPGEAAARSRRESSTGACPRSTGPARCAGPLRG